MLTVPDEHLPEPNSFKISKTTETRLTLYKQPIPLADLKILPSNDDVSLNIQSGKSSLLI
ncbi:unnamed protein product [Cylicostephanus goldi]|uniref:Uncharacterized protein n=1 Tax=Cylicostephanus goldi TaxID=71465 RepID=A0A3P6RF89_CYLGO|nr:unnamed protein product [Cylicostephanus goldi]